MGSAAAQHPPEAFNDVELWTITRQPIQAQVRMDRQDLIHTCAAMPGGIVNRDDDLGVHVRRIRPRNIPEMHGKGRLQSLLFTAAGLRLTVGWLVEQARR